MPQNERRFVAHRLFQFLVMTLGLTMLALQVANWQSLNPLRGYCLILVALLVSWFRITLPQVSGTMSVNLIFILVGFIDLSLSETLLLGCACTLIQQIRSEKSSWPARLFHVGHTGIGILLAWKVYQANLVPVGGVLFNLGLAATVLYVLNTIAVAVALSSGSHSNLAELWRECNFWTFPYYLAGAAVVGLFHVSSQTAGGNSLLLILPAGLLVYCASQMYVFRLGKQREHLEEMASLHRRTIEALALAIEAKEYSADNHLRRLQIYCVGIARDLGLDGEQIDAVRAAAVLHDVGKLAVPEHILSKTGKLTREEFERIKIHPVVGAQILDRVHFPYPVSSIVLAHHEKWDGSGYPHGLKGEEIPLGARILATVDCLDALITERTYRRAISLHEAIQRVRAESGISFDPKVVKALEARYTELEEVLQRELARDPEQDVEKRKHPLAIQSGTSPEFLDKIAEAREEVQVVLELTQLMGNSLRLDDTLVALATGLKRVIPYDTIVFYVQSNGTLIPRYASGDGSTRFQTRTVPLGTGLAGWVAKHQKPILNGNPSFESGAPADENRPGRPQSGLAVHLQGLQGTVGAILVCSSTVAAFNKDHQRVLSGIASKLGVSVENALTYEETAASASTDFLTGLPNARALQLQLESELARAARNRETLSVLVTDLDGFKGINDRFGHLMGNAVLQGVAVALKHCCREYDHVARMGGDEFVLLLPGMELPDIRVKIDQFMDAVTETGQKVCPEGSLGLSVGFARFPDDAQTGEQLLSIADQRMYDAKQKRKARKPQEAPRGYDFDYLESTRIQ